MKKKILSFNDLVRKYYSYIRRRQNLILANKNHRRQAILAKHIERLHAKLSSLKLTIQKGSLAAGVVAGAIAINTSSANAQNFDGPQMNPFSLVRTGYFNGYYNLGSPTFYDLDNDGDFDVLHNDNAGNIFYYENIGTNSAPQFDAAQANPYGIEYIGNWGDVTLVDLDGDGDGDLMIGDGGGEWWYQENIGTASVPNFDVAVLNPFNLDYSYNYNNSEFKDLDNDGDLDMITGDQYGEFLYYENIGTAIAPNFDVAAVNPFNLQSISTYNYSVPALGDIDGDGDLDLLAGEGYGDFYYFENIGTASAPDFDTEVKNPFNLDFINALYSTPTFVDLDNDGDLDMVSSNYWGSFFYYKNTEINLGVSEISEFTNLEMYPNPSNGVVNIDFSEVNETVQIEILSMDGKLVYTQDSFNENHITIDASSWSSGIYTVKLKSKSNAQTIQLVVE